MGRHHQSAPKRRLRRPPMIMALVAALVVALVVTSIAVFLAPTHSDSSDSPASSACQRTVTVSVRVAPAILASVQSIAATWGKARIDEATCASAVVATVSSPTMVTALTDPKTVAPDIWIPDSSLWLDQMTSSTEGLDVAARSVWTHPSIASTPLILATSADRVAAVKTVAAAGWPGLLADPDAVSMVDPATSTEGLRALLATRSVVDGDAQTPSQQLVSVLVGAARSVQPSVAAGIAELANRPSVAKALPATEQEVSLALRAPATADRIAAVYPGGETATLDFPIAQFAPPGQASAQRDATNAFVRLLYAPASALVLRNAGFRDAAGDPLDNKAVSAVGGQVVSVLAAPSVDDVSDALRVWTAAGRPNRVLAVIDLSGSMRDPAPGGETKIQFAAAATRAAVAFLPDTSSFGLWGFSVNRTPTTDWTELVPIGPLSTRTATTTGFRTRRQLLGTAADQLPTLTNGDTGLYNTVSAAYETLRRDYDPKAVNSLVVLTDGANTVTSGVDLPTLLRQLKKETTSAAPLPIITIAVGGDADVDTLTKISQATGGRTYTVTNPDDIRGPFLDAVIKAS